MAKEYDEKPIKVPRFNEAGGFYTTPRRSKLMSKIKGKNTKPELQLRKALWAAGFRYRVNSKYLIGKPDISIKKYKTAIFIDGEFWHGYDWENKKLKIKSNRDFWIPKIERNMQRDREVNAKLEEMGYTVFRFWAKDLKDDLEACVNQVITHFEKSTRLVNGTK
ncbi:very short patch repair endonuclease [Flavimarina sp. Hel_I_48]|uniref:very short patch repair endonuclease n=1 Tax=Flavimarina sp. Hel_I_48 TaxID=1392488 RepID=UPI0004DEE2A4|nr:very short patch repair endonuclease [Flavimarina sp. Hel_I_48]